MAVPLTAEVTITDVVISIGTWRIATIPMTGDDLDEIYNTETTEDEVAARIAARWLATRLSA